MLFPFCGQIKRSGKCCVCTFSDGYHRLGQYRDVYQAGSESSTKIRGLCIGIVDSNVFANLQSVCFADCFEQKSGVLCRAINSLAAQIFKGGNGYLFGIVHNVQNAECVDSNHLNATIGFQCYVSGCIGGQSCNVARTADKRSCNIGSVRFYGNGIGKRSGSVFVVGNEFSHTKAGCAVKHHDVYVFESRFIFGGGIVIDACSEDCECKHQSEEYGEDFDSCFHR